MRPPDPGADARHLRLNPNVTVENRVTRARHLLELASTKGPGLFVRMMDHDPPPQKPLVQNRLLQALPFELLSLLQPQLEEVALANGDRIVVANEPITYAYFLKDGLVSLTLNSLEHGPFEVALVGRDGMLSTALVLGVEHTPFDAVVRVPGVALRIGAGALRQAMAQSGVLREVLMRYVQVLMVWTSHMALANRRQKTEARLALWLLLASDRLDGNDIPITHEILSLLLGTHRPGVTVALHELEEGQMIATRRGQITILDRSRLIKLAGDSYGLAEAEYERLIGPFG